MYSNHFMPRLSPDGGGAGGGEPANGNNPSSGGDNKPMTFDEFLALPGNQAEFDRRMSKGIDTAVSNESARLKTVFDQQLDEKMKRTARDPKTGRNMKVPASMTYKEWHKKYVENRRAS